jgi:hypothetical protein
VNDRLSQFRDLLQDALLCGDEDAIALCIHSIYTEFLMPSFNSMSPTMNRDSEEAIAQSEEVCFWCTKPSWPG